MRNKQNQILEEMLKIAPFEGWGDAALRAATASCGLVRHYEKIAFKGGVDEVTTMLHNKIDAETLAQLDNEKLSKMKVRERIFNIIDRRFDIMSEYKPAIRKIVQFLAMPQNICLGTKLLWQMANDVWYAAGDKSTDFNYYTKRTTLMAVYSATLIFWLEDESENHSETSAFLSRRIENIMQFGKFKSVTVPAFLSRS